MMLTSTDTLEYDFSLKPGLSCLTAPSVAGSMNMTLFWTQAFINGAWVDAASGKTFEVLNPADEAVLGTVPDMDTRDVELAILAAKHAAPQWAATTAKERGILLRKWYNLMVEHGEELARIITAESGKSIKESTVEVNYGNSFVEWFAEEGRRVNGEVIPSPAKDKEMIFIKQPIGVVALITPWNFPHAMITRKAAAALAAGCTCIVKPAEDTPFTGLALAHLADRAGLPKGVLNVITCDRANAALVGRALCESPDVAGLSFTGSTEVGKLLYSQCASGVKRLGLELGGNAPFIVFSSADLDRAVDCAVACKMRNCGQACVSANRLLIQEDIFGEFVERLRVKMTRDLVLGNGADPNVNVGPLINTAQVNKVSRIVEDALSKGAKLLCGGGPAESYGARFYKPTLLTDIKPNMAVWTEEIFGPVAACVKFATEAEAISIANNSTRGLAGYFFSNDVAQTWRVARLLQVGMVGINEGLISAAEAAFGGVKESGIGREGGHQGIEEFTYIKYLCFGNLH